MNRTLILIFVLTLSGCANHPLDCALDFVPHDDCLPGTAGYDSAQKRIAQTATMVQLQQQNDDATCKSYGLKFGTSDYAQCREQLLTIRSNQNIAASNANAQNNAAAAAILMQQNNKQPAQPYMMPTNAPVTTNCTTTGNYTNCQSR